MSVDLVVFEVKISLLYTDNKEDLTAFQKCFGILRAFAKIPGDHIRKPSISGRGFVPPNT